MRVKSVNLELFSQPNTNQEYLEWNKVIASSLFKDDMADRDITLYVNKDEIIRLGKLHFDVIDDKIIWDKFISVIKNGVRNYRFFKTDLLNNALDAYDYWHNLDEGERNKLIYPSYLLYLVFFVLPLTEYQGNIHVNNYQKPVNNFLESYGLPELHYQNKQKNWTKLWESLESWSKVDTNRELGVFNIKLNNDHWKYVGIPFSQCLIAPYTIKKLPQIFSLAKFVPGLSISDDSFVKLLLKYQQELKLKNSVIKLLSESSNDLKDTIIDNVKKIYLNWDGNTNYLTNNIEGKGTKPIKDFFISRLYINLKVDKINEGIELTYRIKYHSDIPEDLVFNDAECSFRNPLWSNKLLFSFRNSFEYKDNFNKWVIRLPDKRIRLFTNASLDIGSGNWIETDKISRVHDMYLLCKNELSDRIEAWGLHFNTGDFVKIDYTSIPSGFSLYYFRKPNISLDEFNELQLETIKSVELSRGLKIKHWRYLNKYLPSVYVENSTGDEKIYIEFVDGHQEYLPLQINSDSYSLPTDLKYEKKFSIKIDGGFSEKYEKNYSIEKPSISQELVTKQQLPKRDFFGNIIDKNSSSFAQGSQVSGIDAKSQLALIGLFKPNNESSIVFKVSRRKENFISTNDSLLFYLTTKHISKTEDFFSAFDNILINEFDNISEKLQKDITDYKKYSLNLYDFLGFIDYDYVTRNIVVNPPLLILIPPRFELIREFLLIGARTDELVTKLIKIANKYGVEVKIEKQYSENAFLLLPDRITLISNKLDMGDIKKIAKECNVEFSSEQYPQLGLMEFSTDLSEYEKYLYAQKDTDNFEYSWSRRVFNNKNFSFEKSESDLYDKNYTLVQYELNFYTYEHRLWINGEKYIVDKNWGRYLVANKFDRNIILYNKEDLTIAIPVKLPLPRLLSESLLLLSGWAPAKKIIEHENQKLLYNIYQNIPETFAIKFFNKLSQKLIDKRF